MSTTITQPQFLNEYSATIKSLNEYEKSRNHSLSLSTDIPVTEKSKMTNMVAELRRKDSSFVKNYAKQLDKDIKNGIQPKLPTYNETPVSVSDISFALAESLQYLYSGESPLSEYYDWVQDQRQIEVDINTNGTTESEIQNRNNFISFMDDRETELKLIISLYNTAERNGTGPYKELAQQRLHFLNFKLNELRRLRERTAQTKSISDEKEELIQQTVTQSAKYIQEQINNYSQNQNIASDFESAAENIHPQYMPETHSLSDIYDKKMRLYQNSINMSNKIQELRGINSTSTPQPTTYNRNISRPKGFSMYEFSRVARDYSV